jgi:hypothetical protein
MDQMEPTSPPGTPEATTGTDAPTSYWAAPAWAAPATPTTPTRSSRILLVVIWALVILIAAGGALLAYRWGDGSEAYRQGRAVGTLVAPFLFAGLLRWLYVWLLARRSGSDRKAVIRSYWVPLGALILIGLSFMGNASTLVPPAPVDATTALRISAPFTLREASPEATKLAESGFEAIESIRSYAIREVVGEDGSVGLLLVADGALQGREGAIEEAARGMEDASGLTATIEPVQDRRIAFATGNGLVIGSWIEAPLLFSVYATDRPTLDAMIEAVMNAPKTT